MLKKKKTPISYTMGRPWLRTGHWIKISIIISTFNFGSKDNSSHFKADSE